MRKNRLFQFIIIVISCLTVWSCSEFEKILKSSDYELKYRKALYYYNKKDYARSSTIYEQIVNIYRGTGKGDSVYYYYAYSNYYMTDYILAGHFFSELTENYPKSLFAEESDARTIIRSKELYDLFEEAVDSCEDVGDVIHGVVLERI